MARQQSGSKEEWRYQDPDAGEKFEKIFSKGDQSLPASAKRKAKNASRKTEGSRKASKRVGDLIGGMNRRRSKRIQ